MRGKVIGGLLVGSALGVTLVFLKPGLENRPAEAGPQPGLDNHSGDTRGTVPKAEERSPLFPVGPVTPETAVTESRDAVAVGVDEDKTREEYPHIEEETAELWEKYYKDLPVGFLDADRERVTSLIVELSRDEMRRRYELGYGEYIGDGRKVALDEAIDESIVTTLFLEPGGMGAYRVTLPRDEFPELYSLKDKELWLLAEISHRGK